MIRNKALTAVATVASLVASLATVLTVIWYLGAGRESDLIFAAGTVPGIVVQIMLGSVGAAIMPLLVTRSLKEQNHLEWGLIALSMGCLIPVLTVLWCTAQWWAPWTIPGLTDAAELPELVRWYVVASLPNALVLIALPMVQARGRFLAAEMMNAATAVIGLMCTVVLLPIIGLTAAPVGALIRYSMQSIVLLAMCSSPILPRLERSLLREALRRHLPLMWSGALFKTSPFFDRLLCSFLPPGMLTFYQLVLQIFQAASQVFQRALVAPQLTELARRHEASDHAGAMSLHYRTLRGTVFASLVIYVLGAIGVIVVAWAFPLPLIPVVLVDSLPLVAICFTGLFTAGFWGQLASAWFHACGRTNVPALVGSVGFFVMTALKASLMPVLGVHGVALGASLGQLGNFLVMDRLIRSMPAKSAL